MHPLFSFAHVSLMISVAYSPDLTLSLRVSGFDLRTPGVALQSPIYSRVDSTLGQGEGHVPPDSLVASPTS